jgi:Tfp pilus assembly protein PilF
MNAALARLAVSRIGYTAAVALALSGTVQAGDASFSISKSASPRMNPVVVRAFSAYRAGDLTAAEREYAQALKTEPGNADALHGAASVALRKDERERAEHFYRRALIADPRDPVAQAGLAGLRGQAAPAATESRLKSLLADEPDHPDLHFALGNIYAATQRWSDAQQAFFSAYVGDPAQPDYLFNLAISLDHLHQTQLARSYYEKALAASRDHPAAFDPARINARLLELP